LRRETVEAVLVDRGAVFDIHALRLRPDQPSLYLQFLRGLQDADRKRVLEAVNRVAEHGPPRNLTKCRDIEGEPNLFELKEGQCRVLWFYSRRRGVIVFTHGFYKKGQRTPPREIKRAVQLKEAYSDLYE